MTDKLRVPDYLGHMIEAIERIERYTEELDEVAFLTDEKTQDAVIRNLEILGEAARNIEQHHQGYAERHSEVPWAVIYAMRNKVSHGYFRVDMEIIWRTIQRDLPDLAGQLRKLKETFALQA